MAPSAPALVVACIRVGKSGNLRTPTEARTIKEAPASSRTETRTSIILDTSPFHEPGKANGRQECRESDNDCDVQEACYPGFNGVHPNVANDDRGDQLQSNNPIR